MKPVWSRRAVRDLEALRRQIPKDSEAIEAYIENEEWQLGEIRADLAEIDAGEFVAHESVAKLLKFWGTS